MMVFAQFHPSGRAKANSWQARIPLRCDSKAPLTIILPTRFKTASIPADEVGSAEMVFVRLMLMTFCYLQNGLSYSNSLSFDNVCVVIGLRM